MNQKSVTNISASIRQKLLNNAHATGRPFNEVLQYYAIERFLYRLSMSRFADSFILKGALMFMVWDAPHSRPTMDIDMLGAINNDKAVVADIAKQVCRQEVVDDGLKYDTQSIVVESIQEDAEYEGVRVQLRGELSGAKIKLQIDIGFNDVITPAPIEISYPTILTLPAPILIGYNRETVIAEKYQAMVELDMLNSRMKDFYDIWLLSRKFEFDGQTLATALLNTFKNRATEIPKLAKVFTGVFNEDAQKQIQWKAFLRKSQLENAPEDLKEVTEKIKNMLQPLVMSLLQDKPITQRWLPGGPWA